jgi:hypothetical protein
MFDQVNHCSRSFCFKEGAHRNAGETAGRFLEHESISFSSFTHTICDHCLNRFPYSQTSESTSITITAMTGNAIDANCEDFLAFEVSIMTGCCRFSLCFIILCYYSVMPAHPDIHVLISFSLQDLLKQMRKIDDNIVYALNNSIPTPSFARGDLNVPRIRCQELYQQLTSSHNDREKLIRKCIDRTSNRVQELSASSPTSGKLRQEQTNLRLMRKELNVEEVIQERSRTIFHDKCRSYYRPS